MRHLTLLNKTPFSLACDQVEKFFKEFLNRNEQKIESFRLYEQSKASLIKNPEKLLLGKKIQSDFDELEALWNLHIKKQFDFLEAKTINEEERTTVKKLKQILVLRKIIK